MLPLNKGFPKWKVADKKQKKALRCFNGSFWVIMLGEAIAFYIIFRIRILKKKKPFLYKLGLHYSLKLLFLLYLTLITKISKNISFKCKLTKLYYYFIIERNNFHFFTKLPFYKTKDLCAAPLKNLRLLIICRLFCNLLNR